MERERELDFTPIKVIFSKPCDLCGVWCLKDEYAYYNPVNRHLYHEWCVDRAVLGR
jgi:hypothetical protein